MHESRQFDAVLLAAIALSAGAALALAPVATGVVVVTAASLLWKTTSPWALLVAALLLALGGLRAVSALAAARGAYRYAASALSPPCRCLLSGTVTRSPVVLRPIGAMQKEQLGRARIDIDIDVDASDCGEKELPLALRVRLYGAPEYLGRDDRVSVVADVAATSLFNNPGLSDPWARLALTGVSASGSVVDLVSLHRKPSLVAWVDQVRYRVRRRIEATFSRAAAPFSRALVLGETDLEADDREAFRASGLAHLLAVSGTHLVIVVVALSRALRALLLRCARLAQRFDVSRLAAAFCVPASWLYADFAGGGGSAYRAAAMLSVAALTRALGWRVDAGRSFAWSLLLGAAVQPLAALDLSFALSVAATAGLFGARPLVSRLSRHRPWLWRVVLSAVVSTTAAISACSPIVLRLGSGLPMLGVVANLFAAPIGELAALPLCLLHAASWWMPAVERGLAVVASGALGLVRGVAYLGSPSGAQLILPPPSQWQLSAGFIALLMFWLSGRRQRWAALGLLVGSLLALEGIAVSAGRPRGQLRVTALDVGQGDSLLVDFPDGRAMLIDAGGIVGSPVDPAQRVIVPLLRERRRKRLDVVVLSHPHPDHYGGLFSLAQQVQIDEFWDSGLVRMSHPQGRLTQLFEQLQSAGVVFKSARRLCGRSHAFGGATVDVLGPCPSFDRDASVNDNSIVLRISYGRRAVLLTGDAERAQERAILAKPAGRLRADLLKVGHHGSRTSSSEELLSAVQPSLAVISSGVRNRFGHPHCQTLWRLKHEKREIWRTDQQGALVWATDGQRVWWSSL